ncbi:MAG: META domain-containing protein [Polyangiaceae bacterium]|nr:META domain-containing protein [Polyangiaceae bacterium]
MKIKTIAYLFALTLPLAFASCSSESDDNQPQQSNTPGGLSASELDGRLFYLDSADGYSLAEGTSLRISFKNNQVSFSAGCTGYTDDYAISGDTLAVTMAEQGAKPDIACIPEEAYQQEAWIRDFLLAGPTIHLDGDWLTLSDENWTLTFLDRVVADPDRPLVGTKWQISVYAQGWLASAVNWPEEIHPWVTFSADGTVSAFGGCNAGQGTYLQSGSQLTFSGFSFAHEKCDMSVYAEAKTYDDYDLFLQQVFVGVADYSIYASSLKVLHDDNTGFHATAE